MVLCANSVVLVVLIYFGFMVVGGLDWFAAYVLGLFAISFVGCVCLLDLWVLIWLTVWFLYLHASSITFVWVRLRW